MTISVPDLPVLTDVERSCLLRYLDVLSTSLGEHLEGIVLYGSVTRGIMASQHAYSL
jgi:hypothetical protein